MSILHSVPYIFLVESAAFGLGPSETLFSYNSDTTKPNLIAVATTLQEDLSSIGKMASLNLQESGTFISISLVDLCL